MSHASSSRSNRAVGGQSRSRPQSSDSTHDGHETTKYPEPIHQGHRHGTLKYSYHPSNVPYYDVSRTYPDHTPGPDSYWNGNQSRLSLKRDSHDNLPSYEPPSSHRALEKDGYCLQADSQYTKGLTPGRAERSLDDYDYGFVHDGEEYDERYTRMSTRSDRGKRSTYDERHLHGLRPPVLAHLPPTNEPPNGVFRVMLPQEEEKSGLRKRLILAFIEHSTNPDYITLGCSPGDPTPQNILDKEAEEEAAEEAKREEERWRKEDRARQSKLRRLSADKARIAALEAQPRSKKLSCSIKTRKGPKYDAWLAEQYALNNPQLRKSDKTHGSFSHRTSISPDARQSQRLSPLRNEVS